MFRYCFLPSPELIVALVKTAAAHAPPPNLLVDNTGEPRLPPPPRWLPVKRKVWVVLLPNLKCHQVLKAEKVLHFPFPAALYSHRTLPFMQFTYLAITSPFLLSDILLYCIFIAFVFFFLSCTQIYCSPFVDSPSNFFFYFYHLDVPIHHLKHFTHEKITNTRVDLNFWLRLCFHTQIVTVFLKVARN